MNKMSSFFLFASNEMSRHKLTSRANMVLLLLMLIGKSIELNASYLCSDKDYISYPGKTDLMGVEVEKLTDLADLWAKNRVSYLQNSQNPYENLGMKALVEKYDSNINLIKSSSTLRTEKKIELIRSHSEQVYARFLILLSKLRSQSFASIKKVLPNANEVKRAIESRGEVNMSSEYFSLRKELEHLDKIGDRLNSNLFKARAYSFYKSDTYIVNNEEFFVKPVKSVKLSDEQTVYVNELKCEFLAIHKECNNWVVNERQRWVRWLHDALDPGKKGAVLREVLNALEHKTYKSEYLNLMTRDLYYAVRSPEKRLSFIRSEGIRNLDELKGGYLYGWDTFLSRYRVLPKTATLQDVDNLMSEILFRPGGIHYFGVLKNNHKARLYPDFRVIAGH